MLTLSTLKGHVTHALGGEPGAPLTSAGLVNEAGTYLFSMHSWNIALRQRVSLRLVANQPFIDLPEDFGQVITVRRDNSQIELTTIQTMASRSVVGTTSTQGFYWGVITFPSVDHTDPKKPRRVHMSIEPTPSADDDSAFRMWYRAAWVNLEEDGHVASIPPFLESLLIEFVRAYAKGREEDALQSLLAAAEAGPIGVHAKKYDGGLQENFGPIRAGAWAVASATTRNPLRTEAAANPA